MGRHPLGAQVRCWRWHSIAARKYRRQGGGRSMGISQHGRYDCRWSGGKTMNASCAEGLWCLSSVISTVPVPIRGINEGPNLGGGRAPPPV